MASGSTPILTPERLRERGHRSWTCSALGADLLVLADYGRIVPPALLESRHGALNLHPSLLPRHRGATPVPATILAGDAADRGDVDADGRRVWTPDRSSRSVAGRSMATRPRRSSKATSRARAPTCSTRSLGPWLTGDLAATPQPEEGATLTRPLRRSDGRLDPTQHAVDLERQVRAYQPWPGIVRRDAVRPSGGVGRSTGVRPRDVAAGRHIRRARPRVGARGAPATRRGAACRRAADDLDRLPCAVGRTSSAVASSGDRAAATRHQRPDPGRPRDLGGRAGRAVVPRPPDRRRHLEGRRRDRRRVDAHAPGGAPERARRRRSGWTPSATPSFGWAMAVRPRRPSIGSTTARSSRAS